MLDGSGPGQVHLRGAEHRQEGSRAERGRDSDKEAGDHHPRPPRDFPEIMGRTNHPANAQVKRCAAAACLGKNRQIRANRRQ
jgi:hypothetical protein